MSLIKQWFDTAAGNNTGSPPNYPTEGWAPSQVNDTIRQMMADIRLQFEDGGWFDWGHTITYVSTTEFQAAGSHAAVYAVGRRVRAVGSLTGTIYGTISAVSAATNTDVTVTWDSGTLQSETLAVSVGWDSNIDPGFITEAILIGTKRTFTKMQVPSSNDLGSVTGSQNWNVDDYSILELTATGNITIAITGTPVAHQAMRLVFKQDGTGGHTLTLPGAWVSDISWAGIQTGASECSVIDVVYDGTTYRYAGAHFAS